MDRMNALDATFLHLEDGVAHMHIGSCAVFTGPAPTFGELAGHVASKLPQIPRYRQRVRSVPLDLGRPVWVDDPTFDLDHHLRRTALPSPGDQRQLEELMGRLMSQELDRQRPLWEAWLVEGLTGGRWALVSKVHHCMVDGVAGIGLMSVLLDTTPDPAPAPPDHWAPEPEPSALRLVADAMGDLVTDVRQPLRVARAAVGRPWSSLRKAAQVAGGLRAFGSALRPTPATSLDGLIGPGRRWTCARASLDDVMLIREAFGGTVNDVVLAAITDGFRQLILSRGEDPSRVALRTLVPVSVRQEAERHLRDNRVSALFADLPVQLAGHREQLAAVREELDRRKGSHEPEAGVVLTSLVGALPPSLTARTTRAAARLLRQVPQRSIDTVTTNVRGPVEPLYAAGREMVEYLPYVPLGAGMRIGVAILSYQGQLAFGVTGDHDTAADISVLAHGVESAVAELAASAASELARPTRTRPVATAPGKDRSRRGGRGETGDSVEVFMRESDAFSWYMERDPILRSTIVATAWLDSSPDWDGLVDRLERATAAIPTFRMILSEPPARLATPRWSLDPHFDLGWHLRRIDAPAPHTPATVIDVACRAATTAFDPAHPMWEFTLVEHLEGDRAALVMKVHHSLTDGIGGMRLALELFDLDATPAPSGPPPVPRGEQRAPAGLLCDSLRHQGRRVVDLAYHEAVGVLPAAIRAARSPLRATADLGATLQSVARMVAPVWDTKSPVMTGRGMGRSLEMLTVGLEDLKRAGATAGGTLNDGFLAGVTGGLRRYHERHGTTVDELRVTLPISIRTETDPVAGNRITLQRFAVPVRLADPSERIRAIGARCRAARAEPALPHTNTVAGVLSLLPPGVVGGMLKHVDFLASNVPGFPFPVYLGGARLTGYYPFGPTIGAAFNATLLSYDGTCCIGLTVDTDAVADVETLVECLVEGFNEVLALGGEHTSMARPLQDAFAPETGPAAAVSHTGASPRRGGRRAVPAPTATTREP